VGWVGERFEETTEVRGIEVHRTTES
jgi:hypothetical protein